MSELAIARRVDIAALKERALHSFGEWQRTSRQNKSMALIALLAVIVAATVVVLLWSAGQSYAPLYGKQELYDSALILEQLEKEHVPFQLDKNSGQILVPEDRLAEVRMLLAARGVRAALPQGIDGLASSNGIATSEFMETVRYRHALEGELARTVMALQGVRSARVHLAIPKRTLFVGREEERASASVMIDVTPGRHVDPGQVEAIVNLIAGSVPGMKPDAVNVVDQSGHLLSADIAEAGSGSRVNVQHIEYTRKVEDYIKQRAADLLHPLLGADNFQIQVAADIDFNAVEETREALDPQGVLRSEAGKEDSSIDRLALGIPGALSNRPPLTAADANPAGPQSAGDNGQAGGAPAANKATDARSARSEFNRQYESSRSVTHTKYQQGRIKHLSVSLLLNNAAAPATKTADGQAAAPQWSTQQLAEMQDLVQKAVGFDAVRGDQFSVGAFNFNRGASVDDVVAAPWWRQAVNENWLRYGVGALIALTLIVVGVRPLVKQLVKPRAPLGGALDSAATLSPLAGAVEALPATALNEPSVEMQWGALPEPGSDFGEQLKHLQLLADKDTARVVEVIKQWVNGNQAGERS